MTINTATNKTIALGDGVETQFDFDFIGVGAAYISAIYTEPSGVATVLTQGAALSQYQITLNPAVAGALWGVGGTVTYAPSGSPIPADSTLTIYRTLPLLQAITLQNLISLATMGNGAEQGLDMLTMMLQQLSETSSRAILANIANTQLPNQLPPAAECAGRGAIFSSDGFSVIPGEIPATGFISSAMAPVVGAASLAAGRTAFGLGTMATEGIGGGLQDDGSGNARVIFAVREIASNETVNAADYLNKFVIGSALNLNMARGNTLFSGFGFWVDATLAAATLVPNAADTIQAGSKTLAASVVIPRGAVAFVYTNAATNATWWVEYGTGDASPVATGAVEGLVIKNSPGLPNSVMNITATAVVMTNAQGNGVRASGVNVNLDFSATGANGLDTGVVASNTWYYEFLISNGSVTASLASLSATAPTLPAGYTFFKRVGACRTNGSALLMYTLQKGREAQYAISAAGTTTSLPSMVSSNHGNPTGPTWFAVAVGAFVPPTAEAIDIVVYNFGSAATQVIAAPNGNYGQFDSSVNCPPMVVATPAGATLAGAQNGRFILEETNIYYASNGGAPSGIRCRGWQDSI